MDNLESKINKLSIDNIISKLYQFEDKHWWYQGIWDLVIEHINKNFRGRKIKILDVGCGAGAMVKMLSRFGDVWGIDSSKIALKYCQKRKPEDFPGR